MGLASQLFRRECDQFCGGGGPDHFYAVTGAAAKAGRSRAGLASPCLAGFLKRNRVQRSSEPAALFRRLLRSGAMWSARKAGESGYSIGKCRRDSCRAFKLSLSAGIEGARCVRRRHRRLDKLVGVDGARRWKRCVSFRAKHEPLYGPR